MTLDYQSVKKNALIYECKKCDFITSNKTDYTRHLSTRKHKMDDQMITKDDQKTQKTQSDENKLFACDCGKRYKYKQGLSKHKKICKKTQDDKKEKEIDIIVNDKLNGKMVEFYKKELDKKDKELDKKDKQLAELKKVTNITNQKFNLNVFLNDTCKDALSIQDFVKSLTLTLDNLEYSKINGPEEGMINILKEGLMELEVEKRPIHCTDAKRETLYIKDTDKGWEKNSKTNNMFKTAVNNLQDRQSVLMKDWQHANPGWIEDKDKVDEFHKLLDTTYCDVNDKKVLKDIAKVIEIEKE